jgi:hypothetical protein
VPSGKSNSDLIFFYLVWNLISEEEVQGMILQNMTPFFSLVDFPQRHLQSWNKQESHGFDVGWVGLIEPPQGKSMITVEQSFCSNLKCALTHVSSTAEDVLGQSHFSEQKETLFSVFTEDTEAVSIPSSHPSSHRSSSTSSQKRRLSKALPSQPCSMLTI